MGVDSEKSFLLSCNDITIIIIIVNTSEDVQWG